MAILSIGSDDQHIWKLNCAEFQRTFCIAIEEIRNPPLIITCSCHVRSTGMYASATLEYFIVYINHAYVMTLT